MFSLKFVLGPQSLGQNITSPGYDYSLATAVQVSIFKDIIPVFWGFFFKKKVPRTFKIYDFVMCKEHYVISLFPKTQVCVKRIFDQLAKNMMNRYILSKDFMKKSNLNWRIYLSMKAYWTKTFNFPWKMLMGIYTVFDDSFFFKFMLHRNLTCF